MILLLNINRMNGGARKDIMDDISVRMKADGYSETKEYRKNQLDLRKKVADFEKKIATGEMKEYMIPRYQRAKALIGRFNQATAVPVGWEPRTSKTTGRTYFKEAATGKVAWDIPGANLTLAMPTAKNPAKTQVAEAVPPMTYVAPTFKKPEKPKPVANTTVVITSKKPEKPKPVANTVVAANTVKPVKPIKTRKSRAKTQVAEPGAPLTTVATNTVKPVKTRKSRAKVQIVEPGAPLTTVAANTVKAVKTRKQREVIVNQYFMNATAKSLPLPELYDPFTGRKFAPEESPMEEIERAYLMLKKIRSKTWRNANTMRKRALKASTRKNNLS